MNLNLTNAGCIPFEDNEVFLFGGKYEDGSLTKNVICFNFDTKSFKNTKIEMDEAYSFNNSSFVNFDNRVCAAFAENKKEALIRINIDLVSN